MKIGELGKLVGCPVETIRFYEQQKILPEPTRSSSNYRQYGEAHVRRLQLIRRCRSLDLSLDEIRDLIQISEDGYQANRAHEIVNRHIDTVNRKIQELETLRDELQGLEKKCHCGHKDHDVDHCELMDHLKTK